MPSPPKAVLFDFDGTLADSYPAIAASVNHVRAAHGLLALSIDEVKRHVGRALPYLLQQTVPGTKLEADAALYRAHHPSVLVAGTRLLPEVRETLAALRARHIPLAIGSNKPVQFTRILVKELRIAEYFAEVLGPEDAPHPKPAPDLLLAALTRLKVEPKDALYIGDMTVDIQTARSAGVPVWVIPTGSDTREALVAAKPDRILSRFSELLDF
jgi:2-phosphoglycolate phosphatase